LYPIKGSAQNVSYAVMGAAPNRELVVQWLNVRHYDCRGDGAATVIFQVVFFEGSSDILINYADVHFGGACSFADGGWSATVGVQRTSELATQFSYDTPRLRDNMALLFKWPGYQTGSVRGGTEAFQTNDHPSIQ